MDNAARAMKPILRRFGAAGFLFFLMKGLFWLALAGGGLYLRQ
jgi:hypothetical protein